MLSRVQGPQNRWTGETLASLKQDNGELKVSSSFIVPALAMSRPAGRTVSNDYHLEPLPLPLPLRQMNLCPSALLRP